MAADVKELGIKVTGDISDITDQLDTLVNKLAEIVEKTIQIMVEVNDTQLEQLENNLSQLGDQQITETINVDDTQLQEAQSHATTLGQDLDAFSTEQAIINLDDTALNEAASAAGSLGDSLNLSTELSDLNTELASINDTALNEAASAAGGLGDALGGVDVAGVSADIAGIDPTALNEAASAASSLGSSMEDASNSTKDYSNSTQEATNNTSAMGDAMGGIAALGIGAFFADAVNGAGQFNDSWSRLSLAVGEGGNTIEQVQGEWSTAISAMSDQTGRGAGTIREYIISMGVAGVTSKDVLTSAFSGVSSAAFVTGNSIQAIESALQRVVMSGTLSARQLKQLGLSTDDVYKATGMTLDQVNEKMKGMDATGRAAMMAQIMNAKYGEDANNKYKVSWEHLLDVLQRTWDYFSRVVGGLVLPIIMPALEALAGALGVVAEYLGGLDGPMKTVAGVAVLLVGGFGMLAASFGIISTLMNTLNIGWGIQAARMAVVTAAQYAYNAAIVIGNGLQAIWAALTTEGTIATIARTIAIYALAAGYIAWTAATQLATIAMAALDVVMDANPIMLIVLAVAALAAGLIWLYNNCEPVRNALNWIWDSLKGLGEWIWNGIGPALKFLSDMFLLPLKFIWDLITGNDALKGSFDILGGIFKWVSDIMNGPLGDAFKLLTLVLFPPLGILLNWDTITKTVGGTFQWLANIINSVLGGAFTFFSELVTKPVETLQRIPELLLNLPGIILGILSQFFDVNAIIAPLLNLRTEIETKFNEIIIWLATIPSQIWSILGNLFNLDNVIAQINLWVYNVKVAWIEFINWLTGIPNQIMAVLANIPNAIMGVLTILDNFLNQILYSIGRFARAIYELPGQIYNTFAQLPALIQGAIANLLAYFGNLVPTLTEWGNKLFRGFYDGIMNLLNSIVTFLTKTIPDTFKNLIAYLGTLPEQLKSLAIKIFTDFLAGINNVWKDILTLFTKTIPDKFNDFIKWLASLPNQFKEQGTKIIESLMDGLKKAWDSVVTFFTRTVPDRIKDFIDWLKTIPRQLYDMGETLFNEFLNGIKKAWDDMVNFLFKTVPDKFNEFVSWIARLPTDFYNYGANIISSWVQGIKDWIGKEWEGFKKWIHDKTDWLLAGWKGSSPPKEGPLKEIDRWGANIAQAWTDGLLTGVNDQKDIVESAISEVANMMQTGFNPSNINIPEASMDVINKTMSNLSEPNYVDNSLTLTIPVDTVNAADKEKAEESLTNVKDVLEEWIKEILERQLGQKGINIYR